MNNRMSLFDCMNYVPGAGRKESVNDFLYECRKVDMLIYKSVEKALPDMEMTCIAVEELWKDSTEALLPDPASTLCYFWSDIRHTSASSSKFSINPTIEY